MKYLIKTTISAFDPTTGGDKEERYEVDEWVYNVITETCLTHGRKIR